MPKLSQERVCYTEMDEEKECEMMRRKPPKTSSDELEIVDRFEDENEKVEFDINTLIREDLLKAYNHDVNI